MFLRSVTFAAFTLPVFALWLGAAPNTELGGEACRKVAEQQAQARHFDYGHEIFFAVLEGCYVDGTDNESVDHMLAVDERSGRPENFVWSCPICMPARDALRVYRARPEFDGRKDAIDTFGPGLDAETIQALASPFLDIRQSAINKRVDHWLAKRVETLRLNDFEKAEWQRAMEEMRKKGMAMLAAYKTESRPGTYAEMKTCPFCEAANSACGNK
jgi:hypothetical protein